MKRFFVSFLLSFMVMCIPFALVKINSYADSIVAATNLSINCNIRDSFKYNGALPTADDTYTINVSLREKEPPMSEYAYSKLFLEMAASDSVELYICDGSKDPYETTVSGGYNVLTTLPAGIKALKYNESQMFVDISANYAGVITINYYGTVTSGGSTYDTDMGTITFNISNKGIYYKNGYTASGIVIPVEDVASYTFDEDYFRSFVLGAYNDNTFYSPDSFEIGTLTNNIVSFEGIDTTLVNTPQKVACVVRDGQEILFLEFISLTIYQEVEVEDTLTMTHNGNPISETATDDRYYVSISAGESITGTIECSSGWAAVSVFSESTDFNVTYHIEGEEGEEYIAYSITQKHLEVGAFDLDVVLEDSVEGATKTIHMTVVVTTSTPPSIALYSDEINISKQSSNAELQAMFRANVENIRLFDGSYLDRDYINDPLKVIIECDIDDINIAGSYFVNYSYTDSITGLTGTARAILNVIDISPELYSVVARETGSGALVNNNDPTDGIAMGTEIYFTLAAMDEDEDDITYYGSVNNLFGSLVQDVSDLTIWRFTPSARTSGEVVFTFYAGDGNSTSEYVYYTVYYLDTLPPSITFTNDIREVSGQYYLDVSRKVIVDFDDDYIVSVSDNSSTPSNNDVVITANGFTFLEGYRFKFENVTGNFSVKYSLTDAAGNEYAVVVNIVIENEAPTAENVYQEGVYQDAFNIDLAPYAKDDTKLFEFVAVGMITDSTGHGLRTDIYNFSSDGKVQVKFSAVYNPDQGRDTPFVGKAYIRYKVVDGDGESSAEYSIEIDVKDATKPVVSAVEGTKTNFIRGREYPTFTKEGYFTAIDEIDGSLTPTSIRLLQYEREVATIDFSRRGQYELEYVFTDTSGNSETKKITLNITDGEKPVIELLAEGTTIVQGGSFDMYNFIISIKDTEDGTKTSGWKAHEESGFLIIMDDSVNTKKAGRYEIRMFCVDNDGNASDEVIFTLLVEEPPQGFPIWILYIIGGAVGLILAIVIIRVIVVKRRMRI